MSRTGGRDRRQKEVINYREPSEEEPCSEDYLPEEHQTRKKQKAAIITIDGEPPKKKQKLSAEELPPRRVLPTPPMANGGLLPAPIKSIRWKRDIYESFRSVVFNQDSGVSAVAFELNKAKRNAAYWRRQQPGDPEVPLIDQVRVAVLAGASGVGKTETVNHAIHLMGLNPGYEYAGRYVRIEGGSYRDKSQINALTGAAPGLEGHQNKNSLVHRLVAALDPPLMALAEEVQQLKDKADTKRYEARKKVFDERLAALDTLEDMPYLLVFIDEMDKMHNDAFDTLNEFLESGTIALTTDELRFRIPRHMTLIILATCNYGAAGIAQMPYRQKELATHYIKEDMRNAKLGSYTIGRLGEPIPYYQFSAEDMRFILKRKLNLYMDALVKRTNLDGRALTLDDGVVDFLVGQVVTGGEFREGIRGGVKSLFAKIDRLFDRASEKLEELISDADEQLRDSDSLMLTNDSFTDVPRFEKHTSHELVQVTSRSKLAYLVKALLEDPENMDALFTHAERPVDEQQQQPMNTLALSLNNRQQRQMVLAAEVCPMMLINVQQHGQHDAVQKIEHLELRLDRQEKKYAEHKRECREVFNEMAELAEKPVADAKVRKRRVAELRKRIFSNDSSDDDEHSPTQLLLDAPTRKERGNVESVSSSYASSASSESCETVDEIQEEKVEQEEEEPETMVCTSCHFTRPLRNFGGYNKNGKHYIRNVCTKCRYNNIKRKK